MRLAAARNLLRLAARRDRSPASFGGLGWALGGSRAASLFVFCALLAATPSTPTRTGRCSGCSAPASTRSPRTRSSARPSTRSPPSSSRPAEALPDRRRLSACVRRRTRAAGLVDRRQHRPARRADAGRARGRARARARARPSRDVLVADLRRPLAVVLVELSRIGGWFERALLAVLGPVAAAFVHLLLSPKRELAADRSRAASAAPPTASRTRCSRLDRASELVSFQASPATEPLYTVNPFAEEGLAALFVTHPPLERRIAAAPWARRVGATSIASTARRVAALLDPGAEDTLAAEAALLARRARDACCRDTSTSCDPRQLDARSNAPGDRRAAPRASSQPRPRAAGARPSSRARRSRPCTPQRDRAAISPEAAVDDGERRRAVAPRPSRTRASEGARVRLGVRASERVASSGRSPGRRRRRRSRDVRARRGRAAAARARRRCSSIAATLERKRGGSRSPGPPEVIRRRPTLPGACAPSTIGAVGLNFSVRNGKRCTPDAMTAEIVESARRPAHTFKTP